jgi:hypothetical protein
MNTLRPKSNTIARLAIDAREAARFVVRRWRNQPGKHFFICSRGDWAGQSFEKKKVDDKTWFDVDGMVQYILDHSHTDLYFCPHGFKKPERKQEVALAPRQYYADLDYADPRKIEPKPSAAWETSPGRFAAVWRVDGQIDWNVNKVWSYTIGADRGGWDATQLLRIPHTINYKEQYNKPLIRVLWEDSRRAPVGQIADEMSLWARVPPDLVNQIFKEPKGKDDKSAVLWGIETKLKELGFNKDEVFDLVVGSGWNRFDTEKKLRRDIERCWDKKKGQPVKKAKKKLTWGPVNRMENEVYPETKWLVPGIVTEGLALLAGRPKRGKSWIALDICFAVATGGRAFGSIKCEKGDVLWLPLEDPDKRLQKRIRIYLRGRKWPKRISYENKNVPRIDEGLLDGIREWARSAKDPRLVVIDTFKHVRPRRDGQSSYDLDSDDLRGLQQLAHELQIGIIVIHHTRKMDAEDPMDTILGTTGITAITDTNMVFLRKRGSNDAKLIGDGRDTEGEYAKNLSWNGHCWELVGDVDQEDQIAKAELFLREMLEKGPAKAKEVQKLAGNVHAESTLRRAREKVCDKPYKEDGVYWWKLK